jgi:hypothetical protein
METTESYRTSVLPDLTGRGATAAQILIVAGPLALLGAQLTAGFQSDVRAETLLGQVAIPLMLAWAAVLFLLTRQVAPLAAWIGLVALTLQLTLVQQVADGMLLLVVEAVGFVSFAVALSQLWWVPAVVPLVLVGFPLVDAFSVDHSNLLAVLGVALFVAVGMVLAARLRQVGSDPPEPSLEWTEGWSPEPRAALVHGLHYSTAQHGWVHRPHA